MSSQRCSRPAVAADRIRGARFAGIHMRLWRLNGYPISASQFRSDIPKCPLTKGWAAPGCRFAQSQVNRFVKCAAERPGDPTVAMTTLAAA